MIDDVGFGEFGNPDLNYVRGTSTPRINTLAEEGLSFMRMYTEPSCTLRSVVKQKFKMHLPAPGVPGAGAPMFDLLRDPREENPILGISLWAGASFHARQAAFISPVPLAYSPSHKADAW